MQFIGSFSPTQQFFINVIIGLLAIVIPTLLTIILFHYQQTRKEITCQFSPRVVGDGYTIAALKIWNSGNVLINPDDYIEPITFEAQEDILGFKIVKEFKTLNHKPFDLNPLISNKNQLKFEPPLLNANDSLVVIIKSKKLYTGMSVYTRIAGIKQVKMAYGKVAELAAFMLAFMLVPLALLVVFFPLQELLSLASWQKLFSLFVLSYYDFVSYTGSLLWEIIVLLLLLCLAIWLLQLWFYLFLFPIRFIELIVNPYIRPFFLKIAYRSILDNALSTIKKFTVKDINIRIDTTELINTAKIKKVLTAQIERIDRGLDNSMDEIVDVW